MKANYGPLLVGLHPLAAQHPKHPAGVTYRLVAGPLPNAAEAAQLCARFPVTRTGCQPAKFDGAQLAAALIVGAPARRHNRRLSEAAAMKLFLPSARATNYLLIVGLLLARLCALHPLSRDRAVDASVLPAPPGSTPGCASRAASRSRCSPIRCSAGPRSPSPRSICCGRRWFCSRVALALACFGIVLYNVALSALAFGLLVLSFARRAPEPD